MPVAYGGNWRYITKAEQKIAPPPVKKEKPKLAVEEELTEPRPHARMVYVDGDLYSSINAAAEAVGGISGSALAYNLRNHGGAIFYEGRSIRYAEEDDENCIACNDKYRQKPCDAYVGGRWRRFNNIKALSKATGITYNALHHASARGASVCKGVKIKWL